jgi:hypothetical protein
MACPFKTEFASNMCEYSAPKDLEPSTSIHFKFDDLDFSHPKLGQDSGSDPEEAFLADEVEGFSKGHDGTEGTCWSPCLAAPPEDFDLVGVSGWAQARDRCAGSVAEERVAAPGSAGLDSAPGPGMGLDAVEQRVGLRHDDLHGSELLE